MDTANKIRGGKISRIFILFAAVIGPGIVTATVGNDSGGIATYSIAGAHHGLSMLWSMLPICAILIFAMDLTTRLGAVTGKGLAALIRERFGVRRTLGILLLVAFANLTTISSEFAGISSAFHIFGTGSRISSVLSFLSVPLAVVGVWMLITRFNRKKLERVFMFSVVFYLGYAASAVLAKPDWTAVGHAVFYPQFHMESAWIYTLIGLVGTTVTPWMNFYLQATIVEKGIDEDDLAISRIDTVVGSVIAVFFAGCMIVASAATIHRVGAMVNGVEDIGMALRPLLGDYAVLLFGFGLLNASIFAAAVLPMSTAYTLCEAFGWEWGVDKDWGEARQFYGIFTAMIIIGGAVVMIPGFPLLGIMRLSQVINGILLPLFLSYLMVLASDRRLLGRHALTTAGKIVGWSITALLSVLNVMLAYSILA